MKARPYQQRAIDAVTQAGGSAVIAMGLGTGKTFTATKIAEQNDTVLVIGPIRTAQSWSETVKIVTGKELLVIDKKRAGKDNYARMCRGEKGWYFINWELMRSWEKATRPSRKNPEKKESYPKPKPFNGACFDTVIADEAHRACNRKSMQYQILTRIVRKNLLWVSATPAGSQPVNSWSALNAAWPNKFPAFTRFADTYFETTPNPFGSSPYSVIRGSELRPGSVVAMAPCWVEVSAKEAYPHMPPVVVNKILVPLSTTQRRIYKDLETQGLTFLDDHPYAVGLPLELDMRLRQTCLGAPSMMEDGTIYFKEDAKSSKIDTLLSLLEDFPEGEKVIVWVPSQKFMVPLIHQLRAKGYKAIEVSGKSKTSFRELIDGESQILCAVHEALAEGADGLQHVCHTEVWLGHSLSVVINEQATGRLHRGGQEQSVNRYLILAEDTIDSKVFGRLVDKYNSLKESGLI